MSNSKEKQCLTVDTRDVNDHGPVKFRTQADHGLRQICYYNRNKTDISFNSFLISREQTSQKGEIEFSIVKVIDNINKSNISYSELGDELNNFNNDKIQSKLQQLSDSNIVGGPDNQDRDRTTNKRRQYTGHGRVITLSEGNIQLLVSNQETFFLILPTLVLIKKITTIKTLFSTFIYC